MTTDISPFVYAYLLDGRGGGREVNADEVTAWTPGDGFLWVHFDVNNSEARPWISETENIDDVMLEALLAGETRPRVVPGDNGQLLVLRGVNTNPGSDPDDMVAIRIWLEPDRILTSQRRRLLSVADIRSSILEGNGPITSGGFTVSLVERLADRIGAVVDAIEDGLAETEDAALKPDQTGLRAKLANLRRQTASIRRYLAPQRDALDRLYRQPGPSFSDQEAQELREVSDRITRYLEDLDLARERAVVLGEELLARLAHEQNSRMYLLSVIAAVFLPLTFVTGLLGMNVAGLPGTEDRAAFALAVFSMGALGVLLVIFFRWKKWI